jgi:PII-like signaling protein
MEVESRGTLLRIFLGESDQLHGIPLYEKIVVEARKAGIIGATAYKGIMGFGKASLIHTAKILRLSEDLPIIIEIVDTTEKIDSFIIQIKGFFREAKTDGLMTKEKVETISLIEK